MYVYSGWREVARGWRIFLVPPHAPPPPPPVSFSVVLPRFLPLVPRRGSRHGHVAESNYNNECLFSQSAEPR